MDYEPLPSFNAQLRALKKGETASKVKRFMLDQVDSATMTEEFSTMRRTTNAVVSRLRASTGNNFRVESGLMISHDSDAILALVAITRL